MVGFDEQISWLVQGIIRRWTFIGMITLITAIVFLRGAIWNHDLTDIWNLCASYLAILIESIVGIGMFSQTKHDAMVIRRIYGLCDRIEQLVEREEQELVALIGTDTPTDK